MWFVRVELCLNSRLHTWHSARKKINNIRFMHDEVINAKFSLKGFSPVCIFMWFASVLNWRNCNEAKQENKFTAELLADVNDGDVISEFILRSLTCFSQTLHWNGFSVLGNFIVLLSALDMRDPGAIFLILPTFAGVFNAFTGFYH